MTTSILNDIKKVVNVAEDYTAFDIDIIMHINSVFSTLNQLGIGPDDGFQITGTSEVWSDFLGGNPKINSVKTYMALKVRLFFDPPAYSFHIQALQDEITQFEWRLQTYRESYAWRPPSPTAPTPVELLVDGGEA